MEIRIVHRLEPAKVARRLADTCARHGIEHGPTSPTQGRLAKLTPLGRVEADYSIEPGAVVLCVTDRPAFLPEGMLRRAIEDKVRDVLAR
jgi:hypothetical protein